MTTDTSPDWSPPFGSCSADVVPWGDLHKVSPFVATPRADVDLLLQHVGVTSRDFLIDLGCGNGSINIAAASRHGTRGRGVDIDAELVQAGGDQTPF